MLMAGDLPQQLNVREGTRYQHKVAGALAKNAVRDGNIATASVPDRAIHLSSAWCNIGNPSWLLSASLPQFVPANVQGNDLYNCSTLETAGRSANNMPI